MGLFKDLRTLNKQGRALQQDMDVQATMSQGMAQMQAASVMLQQQTAAATAATNAATRGVDAIATIADVRRTGMQIGFAPVVELDLTVVRDGIPMPVTVRQSVEQIHLARVRTGETVRVKVDPHHPASVWIDWASPA